MNTVDPAARHKGRLHLMLIGLVFLAPLIAAGVLSLAGWQPGVAGEGEPILPQRNFAQENVRVVLENGQPWLWRDSKPRLTLVALAGPDCATRCVQGLTNLAKARAMLNRNQSRLLLLYLGQPPASADAGGMRNYWEIGKDVDGRLAVYRPAMADSVSAVLVESNGTALSLYPAGMDAASLLRDMRKVIR
jgi:cytochrome oxidase Cu insertion factor (SCO1/SenC/PrrC family)